MWSVENAECRKWRVWKSNRKIKNCSYCQATQVTTLGMIKLNRVYKCFVLRQSGTNIIRDDMYM